MSDLSSGPHGPRVTSIGHQSGTTFQMEGGVILLHRRLENWRITTYSTYRASPRQTVFGPCGGRSLRVRRTCFMSSNAMSPARRTSMESRWSSWILIRNFYTRKSFARVGYFSCLRVSTLFPPFHSSSLSSLPPYLYPLPPSTLPAPHPFLPSTPSPLPSPPLPHLFHSLHSLTSSILTLSSFSF